MRKRKIIINAMGINNGGGLVLFKSLVRAVEKFPCKIFLDYRLIDRYINIVSDGIAIITKKGLLQRIIISMKISRNAKTQDVLFIFNSLPPLVKSKAITITYVHSPQFVGMHKFSNYVIKERIRFLIETLWFKIFYKNSDLYWVQTVSMKNLLKNKYNNIRVEVVPFVDDLLFDLLSSNKKFPVLNSEKQITFFYPASGTGHKNHKILLQAFEELDRMGENVKLFLTLPPAIFDEMTSGSPIRNVVNLGIINRTEVLEKMKSSSALIFPSKAETFGIPLIEATGLGTPIIASELDFVRDVCIPTETFNPDSYHSILNSILRFSKGDHTISIESFLSADDFANKLYDIR